MPRSAAGFAGLHLAHGIDQTSFTPLGRTANQLELIEVGRCFHELFACGLKFTPRTGRGSTGRSRTGFRVFFGSRNVWRFISPRALRDFHSKESTSSHRSASTQPLADVNKTLVFRLLYTATTARTFHAKIRVPACLRSQILISGAIDPAPQRHDRQSVRPAVRGGRGFGYLGGFSSLKRSDTRSRAQKSSHQNACLAAPSKRPV